MSGLGKFLNRALCFTSSQASSYKTHHPRLDLGPFEGTV